MPLLKNTFWANLFPAQPKKGEDASLDLQTRGIQDMESFIDEMTEKETEVVVGGSYNSASEYPLLTVDAGGNLVPLSSIDRSKLSKEDAMRIDTIQYSIKAKLLATPVESYDL